MRIRNLNYQPGTTVQLPFARVEGGGKAVATSDAEGVFDVPDRDGAWLCETSGFKPVRSARPLPAPEPPAEEPPPAEPEPEEEAAEPEEEAAPDVEGLRTKAEALALAEEYGVELDPDMLLRDMKEALAAALYGE